tara:strand:- start:169 stop:831 length:663 start_codon:yes stop_codon:yes gene_type:complete
MDQSHGRAREIDLIAEKLWPIRDEFDHPKGDLAVRLFIECKYVPSEAVFWFADKDTKAAQELICRNGPFRRENSYTERHHYLSSSPRVAKLFASDNAKARENEPFYKALNQALNGMVSLKGQAVSIPAVKEGRRSVNIVLEFPVIVCNSFSRLYAVDFDRDSSPELISHNFQLEVQYAYVDRSQTPRDDYFLLDFVEFERLNEFMKSISSDAKSAAFLAS